MPSLSNFHAKYPRSITLRNELKPVGKTLDFIRQRQIIEADELRNENYKKAKVIIDNYHRQIIDEVLAFGDFDWQPLAFELILSKHSRKKDPATDQQQRKKIKELQKDYRKKIAEKFRNYKFKIKHNPDYDEVAGDQTVTFKDLFTSKLFSDFLPPVLTSKEDKEIIAGFNKFTTYFNGFHENRRNIYSEEEESTAISYRIVHDNFPKFLSNLNIYTNWLELCPECISNTENALKAAGVLKGIEKLDELFTVNAFNLFLGQEGIDFYNLLIGGLPTEPGKPKITGLNEQVNLFCQQHKDVYNILKRRQSLKMSVLFKQILSDREKTFVLDEFKTVQEVMDAVKHFYSQALVEGGFERNLAQLIYKLPEFNSDRIFIRGQEINNLSKDLYGGSNWSLIRDKLLEINSQNLKQSRGSKKTGSLDTLDKSISNQEYSLQYLSQITEKNLISDFIEHFKKLEERLLDLNTTTWPENLKTDQEREQVKQILDTLLSIYRSLNYFTCESFDKDQNFYNDFDQYLVQFKPILKLYNKVRNFVTKKPYSLEKIKINFENPNLASGWSLSKEKESHSVILRKNGVYYLGVTGKDEKIDFSQYETNVEEPHYEKMVYLLFKSFFRMLPKCAFTKDVKDHFKNHTVDFILDKKESFEAPLTITANIYQIYSQGKFKKGFKEEDQKTFRESLTKWIDFCKEFLKLQRTTSQFDFTGLKASSDYEDVNDFYSDVDNITYKLEWINISVKTIDDLINSGKLYLFEIHNKDLRNTTNSKKNLHTLYFQSLFDPRNRQLGVVKLNGEAELFYRYHSIAPGHTVIHHQAEILVNRTCHDQKSGEMIQIPELAYSQLNQLVNGRISEDELTEEARQYRDLIECKTARYDIVKDKRFTEDKFFFHCPITINYQARPDLRFNDRVLNFLRNNPNINIIGIDRGERNLIYATVINQRGEILECKSFNSIAHQIHQGRDEKRDYVVNYNSKLTQREKEREEARRSWYSVTKIKTLKEGYLSLVVYELAQLMVKHNAIMVLEDLNTAFKRIRNGIAERSVYQKFEHMLIEKLNYLVFKDLTWEQPGGVLNGYQLTNQLTTFSRIFSQTGFLFYVPAAHTSSIDPATGFINPFRMKSIKNASEQKQFFSQFKNLTYIADEDLFKFSVDLNEGKFNLAVEPARKEWEIYSAGTRITRHKDAKSGRFVETQGYDPTMELKTLFTDYNVDYKSPDLLSRIISDDPKYNEKFWHHLFYIFRMILQMRNSAAGTSVDYLQSPVKDSDGQFFNTTTCRGRKYESLTDADAIGAYHIALKGLKLLNKNNKLKEGDDLKTARRITTDEWLEFVQQELRK